jgi:addiction module HigA family antidote
MSKPGLDEILHAEAELEFIQAWEYYQNISPQLGRKSVNAFREAMADPGEMLRENFLPDYGLTVSGLAAALGVSRQTVNELLRERQAVSPERALRLSRLSANSPEFWLNAQRAADLWDAARESGLEVERIKPSAVA